MAPSTPAKITDTSTSELQKLDTPQRNAPVEDWLPEPLLKALAERGYKLPEIKRRSIPFYWKIGWEDLCTLQTQDPKVMSSPLMVVTEVTSFPEAEQVYSEYQGFIRVEFFAEDGTPYAVSTAYSYAETGELTPLAAWMTEQAPPFYARIGYIATRKEGRHVVRPLPIDIDVR